MADEPEQILKILQTPLARRDKLLADWIRRDSFAESVTEGPSSRKLQVDATARSAMWLAENCWGGTGSEPVASFTKFTELDKCSSPVPQER